MRNEFAKWEIKTSVFSGRISQAGNCCGSVDPSGITEAEKVSGTVVHPCSALGHRPDRADSVRQASRGELVTKGDQIGDVPQVTPRGGHVVDLQSQLTSRFRAQARQR